METTIQRALKRAAETQGPVATALRPFTLHGRSWAAGEAVELPFDQLVGLLKAVHISLCSVSAPCDL